MFLLHNRAYRKPNWYKFHPIYVQTSTWNVREWNPRKNRQSARLWVAPTNVNSRKIGNPSTIPINLITVQQIDRCHQRQSRRFKLSINNSSTNFVNLQRRNQIYSAKIIETAPPSNQIAQTFKSWKPISRPPFH